MKTFRFFSLLLIGLVVFACGDDNPKDNENKTVIDEAAVSNNVIDFAIPEPYQTLDPIKLIDVYSYQIQSHIFEGLLRFDEKDLSVQPVIAKFWEVDETGLNYTFYLNKGISFHDNACFEGGKGKEVKAQDVVYTFERICTATEDNYAYTVFNEIISGVKDFNTNPSEGLSGVKAIDDYTVQFTLTNTNSDFLQLIAAPFSTITSKEAFDANEIVGTGPFIYNKEKDNKEGITLLKNNNYHLKDKEGNQLPYLDGVAYHYIEDGKKRLAAFEAKKIDVLENIPIDEINKLVQENISAFQNEPVEYILARNKELAITYLNFNTSTAPFNNVKLRKAIAMAIDKNRIVERVLKGEAYGPAINGIVPPAIKDYDYSSVIGLDFNPEKAKKAMAEAGYNDKNPFPKLEIVSSKESVSVRVALDIQKQLKANLGINADITSLSLSEMLKYKSSNNSNIVVSSWLAEIPSPSSFLSILYGGFVNDSPDKSSYPNDARYKNPAFDKAYTEAISTTDENRRKELFLEADQIAANEVPIVPLWYYERYQLVQSEIKNYTPNAMRIHYLPYVKFKKTPEQTKVETH